MFVPNTVPYLRVDANGKRQMRRIQPLHGGNTEEENKGYVVFFKIKHSRMSWEIGWC
jgi:hypothetical protein